MRRLIVQLACGASGATVLLVASRQTFGLLSLVLLLLSYALLLFCPPLWLALAVAGKQLPDRAGRIALAAVASWATLLLALGVLVTVRGDFHRAHSHRDENLASHPELGHAPTLRAGDAENGLTTEATVGQRLETPDPGRGQIVVLGDSVLYGWGVEADETAPAYLSGLIAGRQVLNASVSGYSIDQYLLYLERKLPLLNPDVVVVGLYAGNDYESAGMSNWHGHSKPLFVQSRDGIELWRTHTPSYNCVDVLSGSMLFKALWRFPSGTERLLNAICNVRQLQEPEHRLVVTRLLALIRKLVESHNARLLFVLAPDRNDFDLESAYVREQSRYRDLESILKEGDFDTLWFFDTIVSSGKDVHSLYLDDDAAHYTPGGNLLLARALAQELKSRWGIR